MPSLGHKYLCRSLLQGEKVPLRRYFAVFFGGEGILLCVSLLLFCFVFPLIGTVFYSVLESGASRSVAVIVLHDLDTTSPLPGSLGHSPPGWGEVVQWNGARSGSCIKLHQVYRLKATFLEQSPVHPVI